MHLKFLLAILFSRAELVSSPINGNNNCQFYSNSINLNEELVSSLEASYPQNLYLYIKKELIPAVWKVEGILDHSDHISVILKTNNQNFLDRDNIDIK